MVIAIDGPAGSGKSTVAKRIAKKLGILYLDTGSMYRAFTLYVLEKNVPLNNLAMIERSLQDFNLSINEDRVVVQGRDITKDIRRDDVTANVSYISSLDFIRKKMVELQRKMGKNRDIIVEGRDIGTVVFSEAPYKYYLDASIEERAKRRKNDEKNQNRDMNLKEIVEKIKKRDLDDSKRDISPLKKAADATYIDSTHMTVDEVCDFIISKVKEG